MTPAAFDEILKRLVAAGAEFVVIGGLALGARGVVRATKDIDIVISPDPENLKAAPVASRWRSGRGQDLVDLENLDAADVKSE